MNKYPMTFKVSGSSPSGMHTRWIAVAETHEQQLRMAIPPEFDGPGEGLSPEDAYAIALQSCFVATFKVFAEKSNLTFENISVNSTLEVDRDEKGRPWMSKIHFHVELKGPSQSDNARRILEKTSQNCMILNSVNTQKVFDFQLVE